MPSATTTEIANAVRTRNNGHVPRSVVVRPKPVFVVTSLSTKRRVASMINVQKPQVKTKERLPIPRGASTKLSSQPSAYRSSPEPASMPVPNIAIKVHRLPPVSSLERPLLEKKFVPKPLNIVQRLREGKLIGGCAAPMTRRSTQVTIVDELPPRPSCIPRTRIYRSSVGISEALRGKQDVKVKVYTTGLHNPGIAPEKPSVTISMSKTAGRVGAADAFIKKPVAARGCRSGTPTRNRRLTPHEPIVYPRTIGPTSHVAESSPLSPDLSSFPSQSWTIIVDVDIKQVETPTTVCGDETFSNTDDTLKSSLAGMNNGSYGRSESVSSSPTLSSSPAVLQTSESPTEHTCGSGGMGKMNSSTNGTSAEVSHTVCAATIVSPAGNGTPSSTDTLAKVLERSQSPSPIGVSEADNRTRTTVQSAIEIARTFLLPSFGASQLGAETSLHRAVGNNVSRIRNLFVPPLDKDAKVSKNPSTQMEIEMLRARKKVANGGVFDPRLDRFGSLTAMSIITKRLGASGPDSSSRA